VHRTELDPRRAQPDRLQRDKGDPDGRVVGPAATPHDRPLDRSTLLSGSTTARSQAGPLQRAPAGRAGRFQPSRCNSGCQALGRGSG